MRRLLLALGVMAVITARPTLAATDLGRISAKLRRYTTLKLSAVGKYKTFCVCDDGVPTRPYSVGVIISGVSASEPLKRIIAVCQVLEFDQTDALVGLTPACESWFPLSR